MPEKAAVGEQTIDYNDIKKQFDAIEYDLSSKKATSEFDHPDAETRIGFAGAIVNEDYEATEESQEAQEESVASHEGPIQEAHLKSSPVLIRALKLYLIQALTREQVLRGIIDSIRDDLGVLVAIKYGKGPKDGKLKLDSFEGWLDDETKEKILNLRKDSSACPILPSYSDKTFEEKKTTFFYPYTEGISTFAWAECYLPTG